jgi:hypothetical protein
MAGRRTVNTAVAPSHTAPAQAEQFHGEDGRRLPGHQPEDRDDQRLEQQHERQRRAAKEPGLAQDVPQIDGQRHEQQPGEHRSGPGHAHEQVVPGL